jgi:uncharacterized protein (TIGR02145 family)/uncharacterized repeat protein (TIGR02543 family)
MRYLKASFIVAAFTIPTILFLSCTSQTISPYDISKTEITIFAQPSSGILGFSNIEDTVGNMVNLGAQCNWWNYVDSVQFRLVAQTSASIKDSTLGLIQKVSTLTNKDTLWHRVIFNEMGTKTIKAMAYLNNGVIISDSIMVIIYPKLTADDKQPPIIRLLSPADSASVTANSCQVKITCKDQSGIAFVKCLIGSDSFTVTNSDSIYSAAISGFMNNRITTIMFIASDASSRMNKDTLFAHIKYDSVSITKPALSITYTDSGKTGGNAPKDTNKYTAGDSVVVLGNPGNLGRTGYSFAGWNTKADGSGMDYNVGSKFVISTISVTLYVKWTTNPTYLVYYHKNGADNGIAPEPGSYEAGATVTVTDNMGNLNKAGYIFGGWNTKANGSGTNYVARATFTKVAANDTLYAFWKNYSYVITFDGQAATIGPNPVSKIITSPAITIDALPTKPEKTGYTFRGWYTAINGGGVEFTAATPVTANDTVYAKWSQKATFVLTISATNGSVTKAPDLVTYDSGTVVTLTPVPAAGYYFSGWSGALTGSANPGTITMNEAKSITAGFAKNTPKSFTLTVLATNGAVKKTPDLPQYDSGSSVGLKATANTGFGFINWTGDISGNSDSATVIMTAAKSVTANFGAVPCQLTVEAGAGGTIIAPTGPFPKAVTYGQPTTITAAANTGYTFVNWTITSTTATATNTTITDASQASTTVKLTVDATVKANFSAIPLTLTMSNDGNGTTTPSAPTTLSYGVPTAITASPTTGYQFSNWTVTAGPVNTTFGNPTSASTTVTLTANATIKANFAVIPLTLTMSNDGKGTTTPSAPTTVSYGVATAITATPTAGYKFSTWTVTVSPANATFDNATSTSTTVKLTGDATIKANFAIKAPVITTGLTDQNCPVNRAVTFAVVATGAELTYKWTLNGTEIDGATAPIYTTSTLTVNDVKKARNYVCIVHNSAADVSSSAKLSVSTIADGDGNLYHEVVVGTQVWTMEDLKTKKYIDGTTIPWVSSPDQWNVHNTTAQGCNLQSSSVYGAVYNFYVIDPSNPTKIAPSGWHVPDVGDWTTLEQSCGGAAAAAGRLKEIGTDHWQSPNAVDIANSTGFLALPCNDLNPNNSYESPGISGVWWTTSLNTWDPDNMNEPITRTMSNDKTSLDTWQAHYGWNYGFSVRLVRDLPYP